MKIPELLAPVGSLNHLKVAINAGASSVYLSGKDYGARKFATNLTLEEIKKGVNIAHLHNVKVYVTVNTLIKEDELKDVLDYLTTLYEIGVDGVIIQDLGLIYLTRKYLPKLKIHASTQMNIENQLKLNYLEKLGVKRVILPRELSKKEIANLDTFLEVEIFVHGALCYSYSGHCLMSSFKGGRSGNRGSCAQPCRQKYRLSLNNKEKYYLSPKDLSLFKNLEEIANLNVDSIKIEGRMRNKEYLAIVISNYRKALNRLKGKKKTESEEINLVFNRGFTKGLFSNISERSILPGHIGLKVGRVYDFKDNQIVIKLKDSLKTIPEKGDGLLILNKENSYGFEISQDIILTNLNNYKKGKNRKIKDLNIEDRILIIKKVKENKKVKFNLEDSDVYLSKRHKISKKTNEIENKGKSFIKSKLSLLFTVKNKYPVLKGRLKLPNKKIINGEVIRSSKFEKPIKKVITKETIKKQLSKLDNYPFTIEKIKINYDDNLFLSISAINQLRRDLLKELEDNLIKSSENASINIDFKIEKYDKKETECNISYYTNNLDDLDKIKNVKRVYLEIPPYNTNILEKETVNINYMVNFLKEAYNISKNKDYDLIWKWPDIAHDKLINDLNKVKGILGKLNYDFEIMSPDFNSDYGPYSLNITNSQTVNGLDNYKLVTLSPELNRNDLKKIMTHIKDNSKVEIIVQGSIELMKSKQNLLTKKEIKELKGRKPDNVYLNDKKGNSYLVKKNLSNEELIILNNEELSLLEEIPYLKSLDIINFGIDGRWKDRNYLKTIDIYNSAINNEIKKEELLTISPKNTIANF